jgi:hypothetical protein
VLNLIGRHTDQQGWCRLKQIVIGEAIGLSRETVNRKISDLVEWGYVEKHAEDATGRAIWYRTLMDRPRRPVEPVLNDAGHVIGASHVVTTQRSELHPTCDPSLTSGVIAGDHTRCDACDHTNNDPSLTTKNLPPLPPASGGNSADDDQDQGSDHADVVALGDGPVEQYLLAPVLRHCRLSAADRPAAIARIIAAGMGLSQEQLAAAARMVLAEKRARIKTERFLASIEAARKHGPQVVVKRGTPEWAAWARWCEANPKVNEAGRQLEWWKRWDTWTVPSQWPPNAADTASGKAVAP